MLLIDLIFLYQPFVKNPIVGCLFSSTYEEQLNPFLQFQLAKSPQPKDSSI